MHIVAISTSSSSKENSWLQHFVRHFFNARKQKTKIYRTYVITGSTNKCYMFLTTSKDLQLKIGSLGWGCQESLALFLFKEFALENCSQILLLFREKPEDKEDGWLVTMTTEEHETIFTLAPTH